MYRLLNWTERLPVVTWLALVVGLIVVIAGAVGTIVDPDALAFGEYLILLVALALGLGLLGIGRGIATGLRTLGHEYGGAKALSIAFQRHERPKDPDADLPAPPELVGQDDAV